jgi:hypothetical protein
MLEHGARLLGLGLKAHRLGDVGAPAPLVVPAPALGQVQSPVQEDMATRTRIRQYVSTSVRQ